jgi:hypothetical protein
MFLKNGVTTEEVKIYELYIQRWMKEADLVWMRFNIFFGFNSIIFVAMGFILKPYLDAQVSDFSSIPFLILQLMLFLSLFGFLCSTAWFFVCKNGRHWQGIINVAISKIENTIFENPKEQALYRSIIQNYDNKSRWWQIWKRLDIMDFAIYVSILYSLVFLVLFILIGLVLIKWIT